MLQVQYRLSDGLITHIWDAMPPTMLSSQGSGDAPDETTVLVDTDMGGMTVLDGYYVQQGELTPKQALTITAMPNPFPADGVTVCQVTVTPFVPCTLLVDSQAMALTQGDQVLEMTASAPHVFVVSLEPMG